MPYPELDPFDLAFITKATHLECADRFQTIADAFLAHEGHRNTFPPELPNPTMLKECANQFSCVAKAADSGDRNKQAERDNLRPQTALKFIIALRWAAMRACLENNPSLTNNLGVDAKKKAAPRTRNPGPVGAPSKVRVKHASPGSVVMFVSKVAYAASYHVYMCQGLPAGEESWTLAAQSPSCKKIPLTGLERGKEYYFRVNCFGPGGYGPWSAVVSIMVI